MVFLDGRCFFTTCIRQFVSFISIEVNVKAIQCRHLFSWFKKCFLLFNMAEINNIKQLDGQPWSSWKKLCKNVFAGDAVMRQNEYSHCVKLNREEMPIYGLCPKTEVFELVVCNYCGLKYKLPAFAEHINLRHSGDKKNGTSCLEKPITPKKGKLKSPREKLKIKPETITVKVDMNRTIEYLEIVSDRQSLTIDSETVSKLKQLHVNSKTVLKSSEYNNVLNNEERCKVNESVLIKDSPSHKLSGANDIKRHDASPSPVSQDDERINMQPVVKLCPITSNPHLSKSNSLYETQLKKDHVDSELNKSLPYNPDVHCGVINNKNEPCLQKLDCKIHPASLKKIVSGRSKLYEVLVSNSLLEKDSSNEKLNKKLRSEVSVLSSGLSKSDNKNITLLKYHKTIDTGRAPVTGSLFSKECTATSRKQFNSFSEDVSSSRPSKRNASDLQGLSLPVSIKNPSILCQLQNFKSKFYSPVKTARFSNIQEILKGNLAQKNMKVEQNSQASKENTESVIIELGGTHKTPAEEAEESSELKLEWFQQWHPGYRRVGGLLYTNHNITYVRKQTFITAVPSFSQEEHYNSLLQQRLNAIRDKSEIIDLCDSDSTKTEFKRVKFEPCPINKKPINSVISKQKNNFIITSNVSKSSISSKLQLSQSSNNKAFVCKRSSNNINGALPAKIKRQDGMVNMISPVFGKINKTCL